MADLQGNSCSNMTWNTEADVESKVSSQVFKKDRPSMNSSTLSFLSIVPSLKLWSVPSPGWAGSKMADHLSPAPTLPPTPPTRYLHFTSYTSGNSQSRFSTDGQFNCVSIIIFVISALHHQVGTFSRGPSFIEESWKLEHLSITKFITI